MAYPYDNNGYEQRGTYASGPVKYKEEGPINPGDPKETFERFFVSDEDTKGRIYQTYPSKAAAQTASWWGWWILHRFCLWVAILLMIALLSFLVNRHIILHRGRFHECDCCDDGNPCTDNVCLFDGCLPLNKCSDTPCKSVCFHGDEHHCSGVDGECVGDFCKGTCDNTRDCPSIKNTFGSFIPKFCFDHGCLYRDNRTLRPFDPSRFTREIHQEGTCDTPLMRKICLARVYPADPLKGCLSVDPRCTILSDNRIENPQRTFDLKCIYSFMCQSEFRSGPIDPIDINSTLPVEWSDGDETAAPAA